MVASRKSFFLNGKGNKEILSFKRNLLIGFSSISELRKTFQAIIFTLLMVQCVANTCSIGFIIGYNVTIVISYIIGIDK